MRNTPVAERQQKKINVDQVISYLNHAFSKAAQTATMTKGFGSKNHKGTKLYKYQVEYCYLVNEIQRGPRYIVPKLITQANELIDKLANEAVDKS